MPKTNISMAEEKKYDYDSIDYVNNPDKYKDYIEMRADIMMMKG